MSGNKMVQGRKQRAEVPVPPQIFTFLMLVLDLFLSFLCTFWRVVFLRTICALLLGMWLM